MLQCQDGKLRSAMKERQASRLPITSATWPNEIPWMYVKQTRVLVIALDQKVKQCTQSM